MAGGNGSASCAGGEPRLRGGSDALAVAAGQLPALDPSRLASSGGQLAQHTLLQESGSKAHLRSGAAAAASAERDAALERRGLLYTTHPLAPSSKLRSARVVADRFHHMGPYAGPSDSPVFDDAAAAAAAASSFSTFEAEEPPSGIGSFSSEGQEAEGRAQLAASRSQLRLPSGPESTLVGPSYLKDVVSSWDRPRSVDIPHAHTLQKSRSQGDHFAPPRLKIGPPRPTYQSAELKPLQPTRHAVQMRTTRHSRFTTAQRP